MGKIVVSGATLRCTQGSATGSLTVAAPHGVDGRRQHAATVDDYQPMVNIGAFGMCRSMANPQVSAATASANGVLTPQPCVPLTTAPWQPGNDAVRLQGRPSLPANATCNCQWAGTISIEDPGDGGART